MSPETEAQLVAKLDLLLELQRRTEQDMRDVRAEMRDMRAEMRAEMQQLREALQDNSDRISRLEGRAEEQSKILQLALASRQPRRAAG